MLSRTSIITLALALAGGGLWSMSGSKLAGSHGFDYQPNPLGIKRSPYGQVLAMAIQTPIDADWHGGLEIHDHAHGDCDGCDHHSHETPEVAGHEGCEHEGCDHDHHAPEVAEHGECDHEGCDHDHHAPKVAKHGNCEHEGCDHDSHDEPIAEYDHHDHSDHGCEGCGHDHGQTAKAPEKKIALLDRLQSAVSQRTNPNPPTAGHQLYLRQEIEKKLRFAFDLDPSHYANYNCYHLFITQRSLGTHGLPDDEAFKMIATLADYTIRYCLTEETDPRPALTASSAAYNVLERMLTTDDGEKFSFEKMREQLAVMDFCIRRHFTLLDGFIEDGSFANLSSQRQEEILTRSRFAIKLRDAAQEAINRRENPQPATADAS